MSGIETRQSLGVGESVLRPDGTLKVTGEFAYSSDLYLADMIWGVTLRSPHPSAWIRSIDVGPALAMPGVYAVLTHEDVPGEKFYGLDHRDQPVLAVDQVRYQGEPVALVAADHPERARRAAEAVIVEYEVREPVTDPRRAAFDASCPAVHERGNVLRHQPVRVGSVFEAPVVVTGEYEVGMQDQAFLGPESGLAVPAEDGGVDLYVATQWLHADRGQIAPCLGLPEEKVRLSLAGVGGAFGAREDLSMQVHACMLALRTGRPVKIVYNREESFYGHVHRHPARMRYEHGATREGRLLYVRAEILLDGGAYCSTSPAVVGNAASLGVGPYEVDNVWIDAYGVYTNNPPCGAMRGFGAVQACYAYESQMDRLAEACGISPVEVRIRNAVSQGSRLATGQVVDSPAPLAEMLTELAAMPLPAAPDAPEGTGRTDLLNMPGGVSQTTHGEGVRRGVGYGVGIKNICFSEGFDDHSTARVRVELIGGEPHVLVHTAAAEVGQGLLMVQEQIARTELGIDTVTVARADTSVGSAGSSSASRQSYVTGGAVRAACQAVRERLDKLRADGSSLVRALELAGAVEETREYRHRPTFPLDPVTGQGDSHTQLALCVHRAVVDVDVELGLVKVVELAAVQDVGRIMNPLALEGQIHGGSAQGLGLALMEEIQVRDGLVRNPSFTDYLIPTILDMPPMRVSILENPDPHAPYGLRGAGEPPTLSSTPAVAAAVRAATGLPLPRVPIRPHDIALNG
ncbi:molybdopterin-dependent oxidoreductase [Streptosporangium sp. NBC_01755]|uniref:xanthine dehydrogenase family protein molybdopterin-binding subunit n=1 Tax=unclassified Streptosporangium TaxID=2632669 RepID=UPI002DDA6BC0|nr:MULTISPECIES: molybdopterin cofactor-binding domain-containing protein [unclassified Streptosporangium]WSA23057.1 molybdopterin-dependent oxidoreductase [Streptosporangium sp. NBC_01810]WSC98800.1 molybdopterin-dependent oxidoreductase [Streptosporangium sp. NBC_01755]